MSVVSHIRGMTTVRLRWYDSCVPCAQVCSRCTRGFGHRKAVQMLVRLPVPSWVTAEEAWGTVSHPEPVTLETESSS